MKLSNKSYDILKYIAQIVLPAAGTLYFALAQLWNLPHPTEVVGTITAVDTFLGALLDVSTSKYNTAEAGKSIKRDDEDMKG